MAIKQCPECKGSVSSQAETCPHCGYKLPQNSAFFGKLILGFSSIMLIGFVCASMDGINEPTTRAKQPKTKNIDVSTPSQNIQQENAEPEPPETEKYSAAVKSELAEYVMNNTDTGFIQKIDARHNNVYINPSIWRIANIDQKKHFSRMMAMFFAANSELNVERVEVFDYQSGKRLAKIGMWGFSIDE